MKLSSGSKIAVSALSVVLMLIICDTAVGYLGSYMLSRIHGNVGEVQKNHYTIFECDADIVIFGSSRASHAYVSDSISKWIFEDFGIKMRVNNSGVDNQGILCHLCLAEALLGRYTPDLIIIDTYDWEFQSPEMEGRLERFAPYYDENAAIRKYLDRMGFQERTKLKSNTYRYNRKLYGILTSLSSSADISTGYIPLYKTYSPEDSDSLMVVDGQIDTLASGMFSSFLCNALDHHVNVVVSSVPVFFKNADNSFISRLCSEAQVPYYDYSYQSEMIHQSRYFKDYVHLNDAGACLFTRLFYDNVIQPEIDIHLRENKYNNYK